MYEIGEILSICAKSIERKPDSVQNADIRQEPSICYICAKMLCNSLNIDLVNINAYTKWCNSNDLFLC